MANQYEIALLTYDSVNQAIRVNVVAGAAGGGGGGGAATIADGADVTQGANADALVAAGAAGTISAKLRRISADIDSIKTNTSFPTSAATTSVAGATTSQSLLASNTARKGATFYNESTAVLYLKLGATASTTSYTAQVPSGAYYELPVVGYTGAITGIWSAANGNVRITELS